MFSAAVDAKNFVQQLPGRVNRILDRVADNELRVRVDAIDEGRLMEGMQKVANRVFTGLVLAAVVVASALLYPHQRALGLIGFVLAGVIGLWMVITVIYSDSRDK